MLTIWGRKTSSNVQALMWCVGELISALAACPLALPAHQFGSVLVSACHPH